MGIPLGTAKSRLHRALELMRASLEADARLGPELAERATRMTPDERFDGTVSMFLQQRAGTGAPDYLDDILGRTARTRQRPGWLSIERWPPMDISATRTVLPSRFPMRSVALFAILALLLVAVVALAVGSRQQRLPPPFGPASNGVIAYGAADGDIYAVDLATGAKQPLVTGPEHDETPDFAPNGTQFVFAREVKPGYGWMMMIASADGSNVRPLTEPSTPRATHGHRTVSASPSSRPFTYPPGSRSTPLTGRRGSTSPSAMDMVDLQWRSDTELVFTGHEGDTHGLYIVGIDGSAPRPILPESGVDVDWMTPVVSPDGSSIAYAKWGHSPMIHIVDIDTGIDRPVQYTGANEGDGWPTAWSPDGAQLVFTRWNGTINHLAIGSVDGGPAVEVGPAFPDFTDGARALFSPDGRQIIARYGKETETTWLLDATGGAGQRLVTDVPYIATWQRLALP